MSEPESAEILRLLPSIDIILQTATAIRISDETGAKHTTRLARRAAELLRRAIQMPDNRCRTHSRENLLEKAEINLEKLWRAEQNSGVRRVINATGVIIHTNLGRAPLSEKARQALIENASS